LTHPSGVLLFKSCVVSGFYADDGDDSRHGTCDGPCALRDSDLSGTGICDVQRDRPQPVFSVDDQPPSGTGTPTPDDWPLALLTSSGGTVLGRCRLLLLLLLMPASLATRRCVAILLGLFVFSINCVHHVRLIRCLPSSSVNR